MQKGWSKALNVASLLLLIACLAFIYGLKIYSVLSVDYPKELREMNTVVFAKEFAQNRNPYSRQLLSSKNPPAATSLYGCAVPLILSIFLRLMTFTGLSALQICELITVIIEIAGCILIYKILMIKTDKRIISVAGTVIISSCYWRYAAFGGAFPDQWGVTAGFLLPTSRSLSKFTNNQSKNEA